MYTVSQKVVIDAYDQLDTDLYNEDKKIKALVEGFIPAIGLRIAYPVMNTLKRIGKIFN